MKREKLLGILEQIINLTQTNWTIFLVPEEQNSWRRRNKTLVTA
jgi:hypothetical protein